MSLLRAAIKFFDYYFYSTKGLQFKFLFNIRALMTRSDARIEFLKKPAHYQVLSINKSEKRIIKFHSEPAGANTYSRGLFERGEGIGRVYFLDQINFKNGDSIIDCGANTGDLLLWFQNNNLEIKYTGFEPSLSEFECLKNNILPTKLSIQPYGMLRVKKISLLALIMATQAFSSQWHLMMFIKSKQND